MTLQEILIIIFCHWVFDFVFQSHETSINKSKSWKYLLKHTATYSGSWIIVFIIFFMQNGYPYREVMFEIDMTPIFLNTLSFIGVTMVFHTVTDYFTSRHNAKLYKEGRIHAFFVSIGFDQFLHYAQLFITYYVIFKL